MKSGYSQSILVSRKGIMTNEEIYKYANKKLSKQENRVLLTTWLPWLVGLLGVAMILFVIDSVEYSISREVLIIFIIPLIGIMFWLVINSWNKWYKIRRNYIYNLVREDERKRVYCELEQYEYEGSK